MKTNILYFCLLLIMISMPLADEGWERRAAFDIGSGSTKMVVADVNLATSEMKIIYQEDAKVDYQLDLTNNGRFSEAIQDAGILALAKLKWKALEEGATHFGAVATAAFRNADNGQNYANYISGVLGIKVHIISQRQEAVLGFLGGTVGENQKTGNIVVWDIGGGSMQMTAFDGNDFVVYEGNLASVTIAKYIVTNIQSKEGDSPNPISQEDSAKAQEYARSVAKEVPSYIKEKILAPDVRVIGIGGVHYYSIRGQVKMDYEYGADGLNEAIHYSLGKTDEQIGSPYASTEISNLILVKSFVDELQIKVVKTKKVSMANGVLIYEKLWK